MRLFSGDNLFNTTPGPANGYFTALAIFFGLVFLACAILYWRRGKIARENPVLRRFFRRASKTGMWLAAVGLFLVGMRFVEFDFLDTPFLLLLVGIGFIVGAAYFVYDLSEHYPLAMWKLQEAQLERRYATVPGVRREPQRQRPPGKARGKRRR